MERIRVVIADDESLITMDLREMLNNLGYLVVGEAGDGRSAVNLARELRPDVVLMDIKMPDMDGIEAASVLTAERIAPVVLLTAFSQRDLVERAKEAGVVGYLVKPIQEADLAPAIEIALSRFREFQEMEKEVDDLQDQLETRKMVDRAKGILMDAQGLTEAGAFRRIQKMSMNTRKPMKEIAQAIILTHEAGGSAQRCYTRSASSFRWAGARRCAARDTVRRVYKGARRYGASAASVWAASYSSAVINSPPCTSVSTTLRF